MSCVHGVNLHEYMCYCDHLKKYLNMFVQIYVHPWLWQHGASLPSKRLHKHTLYLLL
ncbi:unnamed protein product [Ixodes pacificus]